MLYLNEFTMNKEDVKLSFHAQKMFNSINNNKSLSIFEKEKIKKDYQNNLFFFKTTDFGLGCVSHFTNLHLYRLISSMQDNRLKNIKKQKIAFIHHELKEFGYNFSNSEIIDDFNYFYFLAKTNYNLKDNKEKVKFIKDKIKELPQFNNFKSYFDNEYYLKLENNDKKLNQIYKNICLIIGKDKDNLIVNKPINIESKLIDIKRNIRQSKNNARFKAIYNFANENKISWLTLTLAHHNHNGSLSPEVKDLNKVQKLVKEFINKLRFNYYKYLKSKKYHILSIKKYLKKFKYFIASQLQIKGVWHFHIMFNIDLLKIFGFTNKMMCQKKGLLSNSEFYENKTYYYDRGKKYNIDNGWKISENQNLIIPNVFKLWADIVNSKSGLPNLKRLNPRSQNLQIFYKDNKQTNKLEINECQLKKNIIHKDSSFIIAEYVSKYDAGLSDKEIKKMILQKKNHLIGKRLFQFSLSCKKLPITKTIKYLPFDLKHSQYHLTGFYLRNILDFKKGHPFFKLLRNDILRTNNKKFCFKENSLNAIDFEKNKNQYLYKYIEFKGKLSFFYGTIFYAKKLFKNYFNSKKYFKICLLLNKCFNLNKLETYEKFSNNLDKQIRYTQFNNYINPLYQRFT
ncbi:hypothetical protein [Candidatus Phytoplasma meliae]|uniref:Uncharacterized protein n=1 Tax=Candidatus Phytoplasma meliae TaxID=1848402 RepID=A0ABS5CYK4_9MOLU|nr:hypothetical protein [Candidatus Phytoplasma meliae]MBP5836058.1 hypothetical protein [Candidatus Phytoplasma meliae]